MQFKAQLADYEKFASLAQLALGRSPRDQQSAARNPVASGVGEEERERSPDAREEIEQCIEGAKRISSAVRGLLNYARPGPLLLGRIHLDRLVSETVAFIAHQPMFRIDPPREPRALRPSGNHRRRQPDLASADEPACSTPRKRLRRAVRVSISAEKVQFNEKIELRVTDTGCGIPADILPHVFEPFFTTKRNQGTGLGLSISQAYVRSHSGTIHVESMPNHGTTVRIVLPLRQEGRLVAVR